MISSLFTWLCVRWFRLLGWQVAKNLPKDLLQYVLVAAPHTSNIDFFVGIAARKEMGLNVKFIAKKELFTFPVKNLLYNLGGVPVDRKIKSSMVDQMVQNFITIKNFAVTIAPEGTRSKVGTWKTGFYHIAILAKVPIVMVGFDYQKKWIISAEPFHPSGDMESDMIKMHKFFGKIIPKHPENSSYTP